MSNKIINTQDVAYENRDDVLTTKLCVFYSISFLMNSFFFLLVLIQLLLVGSNEGSIISSYNPGPFRSWYYPTDSTYERNDSTDEIIDMERFISEQITKRNSALSNLLNSGRKRQQSLHQNDGWFGYLIGR
ncbi:hypothetical protein SNEBB_009535 [Seison nebaliae]|nr:hypothetical protein SNEBB_009535 [Seison nebaliae]